MLQKKWSSAELPATLTLLVKTAVQNVVKEKIENFTIK